MAQGQLWATLMSAIDPLNTKAMPVVLQSTIHLLETELANARAALQEIQAHPTAEAAISFSSASAPCRCVEMQETETITAGAMAAYKHHLVGRASQITSASLHLSCQPDCAVALVGKRLPISLLDLLSNSLILDHISPYLSIASLLSLASTCTTFRSIIMDTPYVFRHMDLTRCRGARPPPSMGPIDAGGEVWRSERMDESLTEDDFYSGPLRGIFSDLGRRSILQDVRTLILDGLSVPADLIADILLTDKFNVVLLSIRECLNLNERKLMQTLQYAVRPSRPKGMPRVKGIYHFTPKDDSQRALHGRQQMYNTSAVAKYDRPGARQSDNEPGNSAELSDTAKDNHRDQLTWRHPWYKPSGTVLRKSISNGWAQTIQLCSGIISFDAVLCRSPQHQPFFSVEGNDTQPPTYLTPAIATVALGSRGCEGCRTSPEGPAVWNHSPEHQFPLLTPPPLHSSRITAAKSPVAFSNDEPTLIMQCRECLTDRWCNRCGSWWCSACLPHPEKPKHHRKLHQTASRSSSSSSSTSGSGDAGGPSSPPKQVSAEIVGNVVLRAAPAKQKFNEPAQHARASTALSIMTAAQPRNAIGAIPADADRGVHNSTISLKYTTSDNNMSTQVE
ncbi:hypothetical protein AJ78_07304 [Emergomyces pasteurianus Ep9510]|uniref:F-box domain-containing protein n=1 Tax=Emergomyces pasteurianus Ep9510 TaxID=1447872 RepID=A0A1J9P6J0_9EURO|nr:hypothetical protein AJ78_07304 [Emergomyces pasteurianus Ep9510]